MELLTAYLLCLAAFCINPVGAFQQHSILQVPSDVISGSVPFLHAYKTTDQDDQEEPKCDKTMARLLCDPDDMKTSNKFSSNIPLYGPQLINQPNIFFEAAQSEANKKGIPVDDYLEGIVNRIEAFFGSGEVLIQDSFKDQFDDMMKKQGRLTIVTGANNLGKSIIVSQKMKECVDSDNKICLEVDGRLFPNDLTRGLEYELALLMIRDWLMMHSLEKRKDADDAVHIFHNSLNAITLDPEGPIAEALTETFDKETSDGILGYLDHWLPNRGGKKEAPTAVDFINTFILYAEEKGKFPVIIFDEANDMLATQNLDGPEGYDKEQVKMTKKVFAALLRFSKQKRQLTVVIISSLGSYKDRLFAYGLTPWYTFYTIVLQDIPPNEMWTFLNTTAGMGEKLAYHFVSTHGGHLWDIYKGITALKYNQGGYIATKFLNELNYDAMYQILDEYPEAKPTIEDLVKTGLAKIPQDSQLRKLLAKYRASQVDSGDSSCGRSECLLPYKQSTRLVLNDLLQKYKKNNIRPAVPEKVTKKIKTITFCRKSTGKTIILSKYESPAGIKFDDTFRMAIKQVGPDIFPALPPDHRRELHVHVKEGKGMKKANPTIFIFKLEKVFDMKIYEFLLLIEEDIELPVFVEVVDKLIDGDLLGLPSPEETF